MLRVIYLALAMLGAWFPLGVFYGVLSTGVNQENLIAAWYLSNMGAQNLASGGILVMPIAALALLVWLISETYVRKNWVALWAVPATVLLGVSCGLPLFLFLRTRPIH